MKRMVTRLHIEGGCTGKSSPTFHRWYGLMAVVLLLASCTTPTATVPAVTPTATPSPTATPFPTPTTAPTPVPGVLFVDPERSLGEISPYVFGTNTGPWSFVPLELMPLAEMAGLTYLRFPGGNYGDDYDLRERQIDQFIQLCAQLGAEPSISVRLQGGTVEQAVALVQYTNIEKTYGVRYWSIGNEPELYGDYDTERYNREWRAMAQAMLEVDPDLVFIGPDVTQWTGNPSSDPKDDAGRDWLREFLAQNGDLVDVVAIHRYPFPAGLGGGQATVEQLAANPPEWERIIPELRAVVRELTGRDLPLAVTEINSHWNNALSGEATPDSLFSAIWWADVLGRLITQDVEIVAHFALQSSAALGGWGLFSPWEARPAYYVYRLYQNFGTERLYASSDDPRLSIYAARREDGAITLMVVNLSADAKTKPLEIEGRYLSAPVEVWRLDAEYQADRLDDVRLESGGAVTLPGQSATLFVLPETTAICTTCDAGSH
ncbi:MAG: hypothetical protein JXB35_08235 [Anaerolineae bacterium]|nr:hypothetical protein [Anaerolineae bacterium]